MTSIGKPEFIGSLFDRSLLASSSFSAGMVRFSISFSVRGTHLLRRSGKLLMLRNVSELHSDAPKLLLNWFEISYCEISISSLCCDVVR